LGLCSPSLANAAEGQRTGRGLAQESVWCLGSASQKAPDERLGCERYAQAAKKQAMTGSAPE